MMAGWVDGGGCWPVVLAALTPDDAHAAAASRAAARDAWAAVLVSFLPWRFEFGRVNAKSSRGDAKSSRGDVCSPLSPPSLLPPPGTSGRA
jgi:hypothetical protein